MPIYQLLTDRTLANATAITPTTLIHIVTTADVSQNPAGSSYKAELGQLVGLFSGSTGGDYLPLSGGTVSGSTSYTNGLSANTLSASTIFVNGTQITGDTYVTGGTFVIDTLTFTNNQGNNFQISGLTQPFSGGSGDCITDFYVTNIHGCSPITIFDQVQSSGSSSTGILSFSFGHQTSATTDYTHAEGINSIASGIGAHAEGGYIIGSTIYSGGTAIGRGSHAEGAFTFATGNGSHAEGFGTLAEGRGSHAEGGYYDGGLFSGGTAIGRSSHAEGLLTIAEGTGSHAEGRLSISYGAGSHAEGSGTTAFGNYSHSAGAVTYAKGNYQSVIGMFNLTADTTEGAFIIGNGINESNRSNLLFAANSAVTINGTMSATTVSGDSFYIKSVGSGTPLINLGLDNTGRVVTGSTGGSTFTGGTVNGATTFTNGLTANTISATTYLNLPTDINVTGATYNNNTFTYTNNTGGTFNVLFDSVTGLTINGNLNVTGNTSVQGLSASTISATTYLNLPIPPFVDPGTGSTINWNISGSSNHYKVTLTATTTTLNVSNVREGEYGTIILIQNSVGSRTLTLGTINGTSGSGRHKVSSGGSGTVYLTSNPNAIDILSFVYDGNILYWTVGNDYT